MKASSLALNIVGTFLWAPMALLLLSAARLVAGAPLPPALAHPKPGPVDPLADSIYQRGDRAFQAQDYRRALPDISEAARRGSPKAQNVLGMMYEDGQGVARDPGRARVFYEQSAAQGYRAAQFALGSLYEYGTGVQKNSEMAAALFQLAAEQRLGVAEAELGMLYELGEGVPRDRKKAIYWLSMSGSQGDGRAQWIADWLRRPETPRFRNEREFAYYIDSQVAAYYWSQIPQEGGVHRAPTSSYQCRDNNVSLRWSATCAALKREGR